MSEFDANIPIYIQIMHTIKQNIVSGSLKPGDKLASVRENAESMSVNPNTIQRAYQELEREGVSETRRGMGTFIVEKSTLIADLRSEMAKSITGTFVGGMQGLGFSNDEILHELKTKLEGGKI